MVFTRRNMDWWCDRGILTLVLAALIFAPLAFGAVYAWSFLVVQALVIGVALLWAVRLWGGHKPKLLWPPLAWAVAAFVLLAVARYFTADIEYVARQELIRILIYAFLFLAVVSHLYSQDAAEAVSYTLTAVAAAAASYAVFQFLHHSNQVWNLISPYPGRASGTYINPNHFAGFLELVLPLPLAFLLAGRVSVVTRIVLAYAALTIMAGGGRARSGGGSAGGAGGRGRREFSCCSDFCCATRIIVSARRWCCWCCWPAAVFLRRIICPRTSPSCGAWRSRTPTGRAWWTRRRGCKCGGRRCKCGATISGGAWGRATTTIVSANIGRKASSSGPITRTMIISNCLPTGARPVP